MSKVIGSDLRNYYRQIALENEQLSMGIDRYRKNLKEGGLENTTVGIRLLHTSIQAFAKAIEEWVTTIKPTKRKIYAKFLEEFKGDYEAIAYIVAKGCVAAIQRERPLASLASSIGKTLEDELEYRHFKLEAPALHRKLVDQLKQVSSEIHRRKVVLYVKNKYEITRSKWQESDRIRLGTELVYMFEKISGYVQIIKNNRGKKSVYIIKATKKMEDWVNDAHSRCELLAPVHMPMLVPPRPWTTVDNGGYLNQAMFKLKLIKTRNSDYLDEMSQVDMPIVYDVVNALQNTKWKINKGVLEVLKEVWDGGGNLGKLPARDPLPLPTKPLDIDVNEDALITWKRMASKIYDVNARLVSKRMGIQSKIMMAEKFKNEEAFYFIWNLDWRGRAYPVAGFLNPQSDDSGRALLKFANGVPLGDNGAFWLAVHIAGLFGIDKCSLDERVQWVQDNSEAIWDSAMNPLDGERFWTTADKPWCALAACFEWLGYAIEGDEYVSHLPINLDGSCNGLQNFSAMLKDEIGGAAVNLVPQDIPADIYTKVADVVKERLAEAMHLTHVTPETKIYASEWLNAYVSRKLVKRPVMTLPYGSGRYGFRRQLMEELRKYREETGESYLPTDINEYEACGFLANVIFDAINEVVIAARKAMNWLQDTARIAAKNDLPIHWTSPVGFPVLQYYYQTHSKQIKIGLDERQIRLSVSEDTKEINRRMQSQGISPNFVHSMDAAHLMRTVYKAHERGVCDFCMVHDSYGTHAANTDVMSFILREAFVEQYEQPVLDYFRDEILSQLPEKLRKKVKDIPASGTLDISQVIESEFFFV